MASCRRTRMGVIPIPPAISKSPAAEGWGTRLCSVKSPSTPRKWMVRPGSIFLNIHSDTTPICRERQLSCLFVSNKSSSKSSVSRVHWWWCVKTVDPIPVMNVASFFILVIILPVYPKTSCQRPTWSGTSDEWLPIEVFLCTNNC